MNPPPRLRLHTSTRKLPPSEGMENTVSVAFATFTEEIYEDPATGIQTLTDFNPVDSAILSIDFSIGSTCPSHIRDLILDRLMTHSSSSESLATDIRAASWLWEALASHIASVASNLGFGTNGFEIILVFTIIHQRVSVGSSLLRNLVFEGIVDGEELENLKMETEPCSICLEDLSGAGTVPTRMPCSHIFHDRCLLEWFRRKSTCPTCRRDMSQMNHQREG